MAKNLRSGAFLGGMAKGFGAGVKLGLDMVEAPQRTGRAQQQAESQAARVERTMRAGANLTAPRQGTPIAKGGPVNAYETAQMQFKARELAAKPPRLRKPR